MTSISLQQFNWVDYTFIGLIAFSALISLIRGFVREAVSLVTWIVAAYVALRFTNILASNLVNYIHTPSFRVGVAFGILFITILIIGGLVNFLFSQLVEKTGLSGTDRLLGLIFGVARGVLLIGVLVLLGNLMNFTQAPWWKASQLIPHFQGLAAWLKSFVPEQINNWAQLVKGNL